MNKQGILPLSSASVIPRLPGTTMARMTALPSTTLFWVAGLVRIVLIVYGEWHDSHMEVPYTDIDYRVFSDAAGFMAEGKSPYMRDTYRYSPLLALILLPNSWLHRCWGKALFSVADLLVGVLIRECLLLRGVSKKKSEACAATWLFNPFTCTVATRGNCEALVSAILLWLVICLMQGRLVQAAVWYGFLVHFRIYPIIYAISILLLLDNEYSGTETDSSAPGGKSALRLSALRVFLRRVVTKERLVFGLVSGGIFLGLTGISYVLYGYHFLHEALLYHLTRTDPRHNFSIYFYHIYLHYEVDFTILERLMSFIPQMAVQLILAANFSRDLPFCIFAQTVAFVAFNKVITAQYFVWFFCLLPLILPMTTLKLRWKGLGCVGLWLSTQLHWLAWAYLLEFRGRNVFLPIWIASLVFFAANVVVLGFIIGHHSYSPLFHRGNLLCAGASVNTIKQS